MGVISKERLKGSVSGTERRQRCLRGQVAEESKHNSPPSSEWLPRSMGVKPGGCRH